MKLSTATSLVGGKGWYWPPNSRKAHYYAIDGRSACGKWFVFMIPDGGDHQPGGGPDDCVACSRRLAEALEVLDGPKPHVEGDDRG